MRRNESVAVELEVWNSNDSEIGQHSVARGRGTLRGLHTHGKILSGQINHIYNTYRFFSYTFMLLPNDHI
jgi:hypothetical protein